MKLLNVKKTQGRNGAYIKIKYKLKNDFYITRCSFYKNSTFNFVKVGSIWCEERCAYCLYNDVKNKIIYCKHYSISIFRINKLKALKEILENE